MQDILPDGFMHNAAGGDIYRIIKPGKISVGDIIKIQLNKIVMINIFC